MELFRKKGDMLFLAALCTGLKPVVSICRSYGTLADTRRYVAYLHSFRRVKTRRYYLSFLWNSFGKKELGVYISRGAYAPIAIIVSGLSRN